MIYLLKYPLLSNYMLMMLLLIDLAIVATEDVLHLQLDLKILSLWAKDWLMS